MNRKELLRLTQKYKVEVWWMENPMEQHVVEITIIGVWYRRFLFLNKIKSILPPYVVLNIHHISAIRKFIGKIVYGK